MIGQITHQEALPILDRMKKKIIKSDVYQDLCKEYDVDEDYIFLVPMAFADLDVSARTEKGCIYFNYQLDEEELDSYGIHEYTHVLQQCFGDGPTKGSNDSDEYLDNEYEQEGFQAQTEYLSETKGDKEAEDYIETVLDHHSVEGPDRNKRKKDLLELAYLSGVYKKADVIELPEDIKKYLDLVTSTVAGWGLTLDSIQNDYQALEFASNYAQEPLTKNFVGFNIPLMDLWVDKYMNQADLEGVMEWPLEEGIRVIMSPDLNGDIDEQGLWSIVEGQYNIYIFPDLHQATDGPSLRNVILSARTTLQHELRHAIQFLMRDILNPNFGKGPGPGQYKGISTTRPRSKQDESVLHPDEFQTYLGDMIVYLKDEMQYYDDLDAEPDEIFEAKKRLFDYFVANNSIMNIFKKHDSVKYKKAIVELYKATVLE